MRENIKAYLVDGWWYLGVRVSPTRICLISKVGRAGDCLRF